MVGRLRARANASMWVAPALILVLVFIYYPIIENVRLSFFSWSAFSPEPRPVGLDNYRALGSDPVFWRALGNNIGYAVVSLVFQVGLALVLAAVLEAYVGRRLRGLLRTIYFIPAVISITVAGMLFQFLYDPHIGLVNRFLGAVGLDSLQHSWLGDQDTAIWSVIAMSQWQSIGYTTMLFMVAIQRIPAELYESAHVDGAGRIRSFFVITVPMVREMTTLLVVVTISGAFLAFNEVMVMTGGGPANSSQVLGTWLYHSAFLNDDMGYAAAIATVIFVITLAASVIQLIRAQRRRVET
ncbi:sugar ABC transporter permease [Streptomyces sp. 891-h]|uniref:carbohydrate ABC transporter permease n=1 Tax=Streptomyces sp. 891-h TaxID=2720714 RepID=UPI001FA9FF99|nr:sugar ABC transporter permease [Streptomyces sp. 891-h]UNZ16247.1 sugar ABC transporter permease [Streptomyces sp. 891-h]